MKEIRTREDFLQLISKIKDKTFDQTQINLLWMAQPPDNQYVAKVYYSQRSDGNGVDKNIVKYSIYKHEINDEDLQELVTEFNLSPWCLNNVTYLGLMCRGFNSAPQITSPTLTCMGLQGNFISDLTSLKFTPNLEILTCNSMLLTKMPSLADACPNLVQLQAFDNQMRVPPNPIGCQNLHVFWVIKDNPITWIGALALLYLKFHNHLFLDDLNDHDLEKKFYIYMKYVFTKVLEYNENSQDYKRLQQLFGNVSKYTESFKNITPITVTAAEVNEYLQNFAIPTGLFKQQVEAVEEYMRLTYYNPTFPKWHPYQHHTEGSYVRAGQSIYEHKVRPLKMPQTALLLRAEYQAAKQQIFTIIDKILQQHFKLDLEDIVINKILPYLIDFSVHKKYFEEELKYDLRTLRQIFVGTNQEGHVKSLDLFCTAHGKEWPKIFDVQEKFVNSLISYENYVRKKAEFKQPTENQYITSCEQAAAKLQNIYDTLNASLPVMFEITQETSLRQALRVILLETASTELEQRLLSHINNLTTIDGSPHYHKQITSFVHNILFEGSERWANNPEYFFETALSRLHLFIYLINEKKSIFLKGASVDQDATLNAYIYSTLDQLLGLANCFIESYPIWLSFCQDNQNTYAFSANDYWPSDATSEIFQQFRMLIVSLEELKCLLNDVSEAQQALGTSVVNTMCRTKKTCQGLTYSSS